MQLRRLGRDVEKGVLDLIDTIFTVNRPVLPLAICRAVEDTVASTPPKVVKGAAEGAHVTGIACGARGLHLQLEALALLQLLIHVLTGWQAPDYTAHCFKEAFGHDDMRAVQMRVLVLL